MSKFIYVFEKRAAKDLQKHGFELLKYDERNSIWIFVNKATETFELEFANKYQMVLSDVVSM